MKVNREVLENELENFISAYGYSRRLKEHFSNELAKRNIMPGDAENILKKTLPVTTLSMPMLYVTTEALYKVLECDEKEKLNPNKFFTDLEIDKMKNYTIDLTKKDKFPIVIENVIKFCDDFYSGVTTPQMIDELYSINAITYDPETQRQLIKKESQGKIIERIDLKAASSREIKENIKTGNQFPSHLTLNLVQNGDDEFDYNEKTRTLTIYSGIINIVNGFHRSNGIINAVRENPDVEYPVGINITNYEIDKAKAYMAQEYKANKMDEKFMKSIDTDNPNNAIVKKINENSNSYLKKKITIDQLMIKQNKSLVDFNVLMDSIEILFNAKETKDVIKYSKHIIDRFNYIIDLKPELLEKSVENQFIWAMYVALIKLLENNDNWDEQIYEILPKIDENVLNDYKIINKKTLDKMSMYLKNLM